MQNLINSLLPTVIPYLIFVGIWLIAVRTSRRTYNKHMVRSAEHMDRMEAMVKDIQETLKKNCSSKEI